MPPPATEAAIRRDLRFGSLADLIGLMTLVGLVGFIPKDVEPPPHYLHHLPGTSWPAS